jgi:hypothetical protein
VSYRKKYSTVATCKESNRKTEHQLLNGWFNVLYYCSVYDEMASKKRKALSTADKIEILRKHDENVVLKQCELAESLGIPGSTLRTILNDRKRIEEDAKNTGGKRQKLRSGKFEELEDILMKWFLQARATNIPINGPVLKEKATEIAKKLKISDFTSSNGWLDRFRKRHGIVYRQISGESESVDKSCVSTWLMQLLPPLINKFSPEDVFNADEFGLFFKLMPDKSFVCKDEKCSGGKLSKERLTVLLCSNSDGSEKLPPLVIGKSCKPRCFKHVKRLPCDYAAQRKAWMSGDRFTTWLKNLDAEMARKKRSILLLIDNCPAHPKDVSLKNIRVEFLPPNSTSCTQPLDQGIIKVTKQKYRRRLIQRYIYEIDHPENAKPVTVLDALHFITASWEDVSVQTIRNCFKKAGFSNTDAILPTDADEPIDIETIEKLKALDIDMDEYVRVDDGLSTSEEQSLDQIINEFQSEGIDDESDNDEDVCEPPPSKLAAFNSLSILRHYLSSLPNVPQEVFLHVNSMENIILQPSGTKQLKIDNFLKGK